MKINTVFSNIYIGRTNLNKATEPVIGYKRASLMLEHGGADIAEVFIAPLHSPDELDRVSFNDNSSCPIFSRFHAGKPHMLCTCGFYSYSKMQDAIDHNENQISPLLKTVSSGKMVMYAKGVRAGHQRVEEVIFQACYSGLCDDVADRVVVKNFSTYGLEIMGCCGNHEKTQNTRSFSWLEAKINHTLKRGEPKVKVRQLDDSVEPWNGSTLSAHQSNELLTPISVYLKEHAFFLSVLSVSFLGAAGIAVSEFSKLF